MLTKSKLSSIDTLISQALIDMDISHEEFITIWKEKDEIEIGNEILKWWKIIWKIKMENLMKL